MSGSAAAATVAVIDARAGSGAPLVAGLLRAAMPGEGHVLAYLDPRGLSDELLAATDIGPAESRPLEGGDQARISVSCLGCGSCLFLCRFGAIRRTLAVPGRPPAAAVAPWHVDPLSCVGCGVCARFCPSNAICMSRPIVGSIHVCRGRSPAGAVVFARLAPGREITPGIAGRVIQEGKNLRSGAGSRLFVTGIAAPSLPAVSVCAGADAVIFTISPVPGAERFLEHAGRLAAVAGRRALVVITDADRSPERTESLEAASRAAGVETAGRLSYAPAFHAAAHHGNAIQEVLSSDAVAGTIRFIVNTLL